MQTSTFSIYGTISNFYQYWYSTLYLLYNIFWVTHHFEHFFGYQISYETREGYTNDCRAFVCIVYGVFLLFWTTVKVYDDKTMEVTTKTIFGSKTYRYKDITKIKLYHVPKGGYAIRVYQAGVEKPRFNGSFGYKNAQQLVAFFQKTSLPFETKLFQKK